MQFSLPHGNVKQVSKVIWQKAASPRNIVLLIFANVYSTFCAQTPPNFRA